MSDETGHLPENALRALEAILIEHESVAGERIHIRVYKSSGPNQSPIEHAREVFRALPRQDDRFEGENKNLLVALYWNDHDAAVIGSIEMESVLGSNQLEELEEHFEEAISSAEITPPLLKASSDLMRALDSPIAASGKIEEILEEWGYAAPSLTREAPPSALAWFLPFVVGLLFVFYLLYLVLSAEAHVTSDGVMGHGPTQELRLWYQILRSKRKAVT